MGVLRQKTVAGMDGVDIAQFRRTNNAVNLQITVLTRLFTDTDGFVCQRNVQRIDICGGIDRQRLDPKFLARTNNAKGYLAAVGDQNFVKHGSDDGKG